MTIRAITPLSPRRHEGTKRVRHVTSARVAMDACCVSAVRAVRTRTRRRTAKSCGPGAATLALRRRKPATGARKAASPGRARISRKTIARGKPGCFGCTCQIRVHSTPRSAHGDAGAVGARLSLRPLFKEGQRTCTTRAKTGRGNESAFSLHRHCEERSDDPSPLAAQATPGSKSAEARRAKAEAIHRAASRQMDCFASLAMTVVSSLKFEYGTSRLQSRGLT